jgi:hypothetical protein
MNQNQNQNRENFEKWFKEPLSSLYTNVHAGFPIVIITLPLLERYLRELTNTQDNHVGTSFYKGLLEIFPALNDVTTSKMFWQTYRHGMLHRSTLKLPDGVLKVGLDGSVKAEIECSISSSGYVFKVVPVAFSKKVISTIEADFPTFEGDGSGEHPVSQVSAPAFSGVKR